MHQTYGQIPDIRHMPDSGYPAACLLDPDIKKCQYPAPDIWHNPNQNYIIFIEQIHLNYQIDY